jgi:hypothetical protein
MLLRDRGLAARRLGGVESVWEPNYTTDCEGNWFLGTNTGLIHSCFSAPHDTAAAGHVEFLAGTGINLKHY